MNKSDKMTLDEVLQLSLDEYIAETGLHYSPLSNQHKGDRYKNSNVEMYDQVEGVQEEGANNYECDLTVNVQQNQERRNFQVNSQQVFTRRSNRINPFGTWNPRQQNNYKRSRSSKNRKRNINNKRNNSNFFEQQGKGNNFSMQNRDKNANNLTFQSSMLNMSRNLHKLPNSTTATNLNAQAVAIPNFIITNGQRNQSFMRPLQSISGNNQYDLTNYSNANLQPTMLANTCGSINTEIMPYLTAKLLEFLSNNSPKYDMNIQKEIHSIQGKPIVYRCNGHGGDIISSDGPGLNCILTPASTGLTLNQRFA